MYCKEHKESFGAFHSECPSCRIDDLSRKLDQAIDLLDMPERANLLSVWAAHKEQGSGEFTFNG